MEAILLGFCLASLVLASAIVMFELMRDGRRQQSAHDERADITQYEFEAPAAPSARTAADPQQAQHQKALGKLKRQLAQLGYLSAEKQVGFANWALGSQHADLEQIEPQDLVQLFKTIQRYSAERGAAAGMSSPIAAAATA